MSAKAAVAASSQVFVTASTMNSVRIGMLADRLSLLSRSGIRSDTSNADLFNTCLFLAKGIDYAITHNEVPPAVRDLPSIIKQVFQFKTDTVLQSAIMLLMISIKNACRNGWFQAKDTDELLTLTNEISSNFSGATITAIDPSNVLQITSDVISRFYPRMKMGQIIVSFEAKPGYEAFASDFLIERSMLAAKTQERIRLFVVQTDDMDTSSCIVTPPEVNFMLNGKGVERRNNISMDGGPQFPTDVTNMLKYGTNLIQVIGKFNGNYVIILACASVVSSFNSCPLQYYVQPSVAEHASDSEIIEGPSRISLNCPISYKPINTPVKGHICRHHQCFDYDSFLEINSIKPSWRCPHCNQPVCFTGLRMDQNMVKILKEVGEDVTEVLISADGSWSFVDERDNYTNQLQNGSITGQQDVLEHSESERTQDGLANVIDLTMDGTDDGDTTISSTGVEASICLTNQRSIHYTSCDTEDRKPFQDSQSSSPARNFPMATTPNTTTDSVHEPVGQIWQNVWSRISSLASTLNGSAIHSAAAATWVDAPVGNSESFRIDPLLAPVLTDAISLALNREPVDGHVATQLTTTLQNVPQLRQSVAPENSQLQQPQFEISFMSDETLRRSIPRQVSRTPIAIQALPAQTQVPNTHHQRTRPNVMPSTMISNGASSGASQIPQYMTTTPDSFSAASSEIERQQLSRAQISPLPALDFNSSSSQPHTMSQTRDLQYQNQLMQQVALPATSQVGTSQQHTTTYRASSGLLPLDHQNLCHQRPPNAGVSQTISWPERVTTLAAGSSSSSQHIRPPVPQHSSQMVRPPGIAARLQSSMTSSYATNTGDLRQYFGERRWQPVNDSSTEIPSEENWRRSVGRMRGSLTGQSYSAALSQLMVQPTPPAQASVPVTALQALMNFPGQSQVNTSTEDIGRTGS